MEFYDIVDWKLRLMRKLNDDVLNIDEWERFIVAAQACNCYAIADDMCKRLQHYAGAANTNRPISETCRISDEEQLNLFRKLYKEQKHVPQS